MKYLVKCLCGKKIDTRKCKVVEFIDVFARPVCDECFKECVKKRYFKDKKKPFLNCYARHFKQLKKPRTRRS